MRRSNVVSNVHSLAAAQARRDLLFPSTAGAKKSLSSAALRRHAPAVTARWSGGDLAQLEQRADGAGLGVGQP